MKKRKRRSGRFTLTIHCHRPLLMVEEGTYYRVWKCGKCKRTFPERKELPAIKAVGYITPKELREAFKLDASFRFIVEVPRGGVWSGIMAEIGQDIGHIKIVRG